MLLGCEPKAAHGPADGAATATPQAPLEERVPPQVEELVPPPVVSTGACQRGLTTARTGEMSVPKVFDAPEARVWAKSAELAIDVAAQRTGDAVTFSARVRNTAEIPLDWVYLTTGEPGETSPVSVAPAHLIPLPEPSRAPIGLPFPERVRLQPGAEIRYYVRVCLADYKRPWPASIPLHWSVEAWGKSRLAGELVAAPKK